MRFPQEKHRPLWIGAVGLWCCRSLLQALGLTLDTATVVVILAIAVTGLNLLRRLPPGSSRSATAPGSASAATRPRLAQLHWFKGSILLPLLFAVAFTALLSARRRLPHPAPPRRVLLAADAGAVRPDLRHRVPLDRRDRRRRRPGRHRTPHARAVRPERSRSPSTSSSPSIAFAVLVALLRVVRSPFGHVLVAIRENEQRATFQGYPTPTSTSCGVRAVGRRHRARRRACSASCTGSSPQSRRPSPSRASCWRWW